MWDRLECTPYGRLGRVTRGDPALTRESKQVATTVEPRFEDGENASQRSAITRSTASKKARGEGQKSTGALPGQMPVA